MRSRKFRKRKRTTPPRSQVDLERLDSRLLLSTSNEWLGGINPDSIDFENSESARLLENLNDLFHHHGDHDGEPGSYYSDPSSWDLSSIFGSHQEFSQDQLHDWVDAIFQDDHTALTDHLLEDNVTPINPIGNDPYVSNEVLTAGGGHVLYLDFDGGVAQGRSSDSWLYSYHAQIEAYDLSQYGWAGRESESAGYITEFLREDYAAYNLSVVTEEPSSGDYTTIFVGGNNDWFQANSGVIGVATYDVGNYRASNYGFAFTEELNIYYNYSAGDLVHFSEYVANLISHEAGHTFGANHISDTTAIMNPYLPISPRTSMFGSNTIYGSTGTQDTQSLLGNNLGYAHGEDDFGDIFATAETISTGAIEGILERRGDVDVFEFSALRDETLMVDLNTSVYGNLESNISIYRGSDSSLIAQMTDDGLSDDSYLNFSTTAGESYYIMVASENSATSGAYQLLVGTHIHWAPDAQINPSDLEPVVVELNQFGDQSFSESLSALSVSQVYQVMLDVNGPITIDLNDNGLGAYGALYDGDGQLLDWDDASFSVDALSGQAYYLVVGGVEEGAAGDYDLMIDSPSVVTAPISLDSNGSGRKNGSIGVGDSDYFQFTVPDNGADYLFADVSLSGSWASVLTLYDDDGQRVGRSADGSLDVRSLVGGETYVLRISDAIQQDSGDYTLDLYFAQPSIGPGIDVTDSLNDATDHLLDFDRLTVDTIESAVMTIRNTGLLDLVITELSIGSGFALDTQSAAHNSHDDLTVAPGQSLDVMVTFQPDQVAPYSSQLIIASNANDPVSLSLDVTGLSHAPEADLSISEPVIDLGEILRNDSQSQIVTLTNNGLADLVLNDVTIVAPLSLIGTVPTTLSPGDSVDLTIAIDTSHRGPIESVIHILSNDPDSPDSLIEIEGQVLGGVLAVDQTSPLDFGSVRVGSSAEQQIVFTNEGDADLLITSLLTTSDFSLLDTLSASDLLLEVGESLTMTLDYSPTILDDLVGLLTITTDDSESPLTEINLTGSTLAGVLEVVELDGQADGLVDMGRQRANVSYEIDVWKLKNNGNIPVTVSLTLAHDRDYHLASEGQVVIAAGAEYIVSMELNTKMARQVGEQLFLQADDFSQTTSSLNVTAEAYALIGQGERYRFIDHSGDWVMMSLSGHSLAEVVIGQSNEPDISSITLLAGEGYDRLGIKVKGPGRTELGELTGNVGLRAITGAKVDLVGEGISLGGNLRSLRLGHVLGAASIEFSTEEYVPAKVRLENVNSSGEINIQGGVKSLSVDAFDGGRLTADSIRVLKINDGAMDTPVRVIDGNLDRLIIRSGSLNESVGVQGSIGKISVRDGDIEGDISAQDYIGSITAKNGTLRSQVQSEDSIGKIMVQNMADAQIKVLQGVKKISVTEDMIASSIVIGFTEASQAQHGLESSLPINAFLRSLNVKGTFSSSNVAVGVAPDSEGNFLNGVAATSEGTIGRIVINQVETDNGDDPFGLIARSDIQKLVVNRQKIGDDYQQDNFRVSTLSL